MRLKKPAMGEGLNRVAWDLRYDAPAPRREAEDEASDFTPPPSGPYVLPGAYTLRLTVNGDKVERPLTVRVDPLVRASAQALEAQFEVAQALTQMRSDLNRSLRALDAVKSQLEERRKLAAQLGRPVEGELHAVWTETQSALKDVLEALSRPEDVPFYAIGPRLSDRVAQLFGEVDDAFAAPTPAQRGYFAELQGETKKALERAHAFMQAGLTRLNEALARAQWAPVVAPR